MEQTKEIFNTLKISQNIVIIAHKSPDGDSIGSSLALYHYLKAVGKKSVIVHPDVSPDFLHWMPEVESIITYEQSQEKASQLLLEADCIVCLDFNSPSRIGKLEDSLRNSKAKKLMIDHHLNPDLDFFDYSYSNPSVCSTAQLIFEFIEKEDTIERINTSCATCIYTGIMTDTGSFRFSSVTPKTHLVLAELLKTGISSSKIHEMVFDQNSIDQIRLSSYAILEKLVVMDDLNIGYISLCEDELERFNAKKGDTEGLVNKILGIVGIKMAIFLKEDKDLIKISFRSVGEIPVNQFAERFFYGGGHLNAAGGRHVGKMSDAIEKIVTYLPKFVEINKDKFDAC